MMQFLPFLVYKQLGIQQYEIENSLLLVIAQRLVRKLCSKCGGNLINSCDCHQGYRGRIGVYQFLHWQQNGYQTDFEEFTREWFRKKLAKA